MKLKYYEIDDKKLIKEAKKGKKIGIKLPEGFSPYICKILRALKRERINAAYIADSCYGACDFLNYEEFDRIICIGEAKMPYLNYKPPVSFIEAKYSFNEELLKNVFKYLKGKRIGLVSITPFIHKIKDCKKFLEKNGYEVYIGSKSRRTFYDGQILGCDFSSAMQIADKVDCFIYIGDGFFHPIGLYIAIKKPVIIFNPIEKRIYDEEVKKLAEKIMKKRYALITKAMNAKKFGIITSIKIGQKRLELARKIKKLIEEKGKEAYLIFLNEINENIDYLDFDCYISTACPRVAIDDADKFAKPILTPIELQILFGERKWEAYEFDQIL